MNRQVSSPDFTGSYVKIQASQVALVVKNLHANAGDIRDASSIPGLGRSLGEGKGQPLQYSGLENSMDFVVHGVAKSWTRLSNFTLNVMVEAKKNFTM